jgi:hypothetical protein
MNGQPSPGYQRAAASGNADRPRDPQVPASMGSSDDYSQLDDFRVLEERRRVQGWLAEFTDRYKALNDEMGRRDTLRWMVAP